MLNHHSVIHLIISLTLTLLNCSFNTHILTLLSVESNKFPDELI